MLFFGGLCAATGVVCIVEYVREGDRTLLLLGFVNLLCAAINVGVHHAIN